MTELEEIEALIRTSLKIADAMEKYGGSFVKHLGAALRKADLNNIQRIKDAFPEYWANYLEISAGTMKEAE